MKKCRWYSDVNVIMWRNKGLEQIKIALLMAPDATCITISFFLVFLFCSAFVLCFFFYIVFVWFVYVCVTVRLFLIQVYMAILCICVESLYLHFDSYALWWYQTRIMCLQVVKTNKGVLHETGIVNSKTQDSPLFFHSCIYLVLSPFCT